LHVALLKRNLTKGKSAAEILDPPIAEKGSDLTLGVADMVENDN
jgi:hypothetical protein